MKTPVRHLSVRSAIRAIEICDNSQSSQNDRKAFIAINRYSECVYDLLIAINAFISSF